MRLCRLGVLLLTMADCGCDGDLLCKFHRTEKQCPTCKIVKPVSEYHRAVRRGDGKAVYCKDCTHLWFRRYHLTNTYGITPEQYEAMLAEQGGVCAICRRKDKGRNLAVDHDHETGQVRGLLCQACNRAIGQLGEDPDRLDTAVSYLRRWAHV